MHGVRVRLLFNFTTFANERMNSEALQIRELERVELEFWRLIDYTKHPILTAN